MAYLALGNHWGEYLLYLKIDMCYQNLTNNIYRIKIGLVEKRLNSPTDWTERQKDQGIFCTFRVPVSQNVKNMFPEKKLDWRDHKCLHISALTYSL